MREINSMLGRTLRKGTRLGGVAEVAEMCGVRSSAVANWAVREVGMPAPVVVLKAGPIYDLGEVAAWHLERRAKRAWL